jgi:hypothetical protein
MKAMRKRAMQSATAAAVLSYGMLGLMGCESRPIAADVDAVLRVQSDVLLKSETEQPEPLKPSTHQDSSR